MRALSLHKEQKPQINIPHLDTLSGEIHIPKIESFAMADHSSDDLDQLLDSALDDFSTLDLSSTRRDGGGTGETPSSSSSSSVKGLGLGLGSGLPELGAARKKGKQRAAAPPSKESHASAALEELTRQTREAVRGLESATAARPPLRGGFGLEKEGMMEDFVKQFEELAGSQDMGSIVETMMQQLLSKEILQEPMKEIGEKYPKWLEEHKAELKPEDYDRYSRQHGLILQLNDVYEHDSDNFQKIVDLMQKMQECGQPPNDIVQELAPDLDMANLAGQLSPDMLESNPNCSIM